jgi:type III pantothenate kinase
LQSSFTCRLGEHWQLKFNSILSIIKATRCFYASVANPEVEKLLLSSLKNFLDVDTPVRLRSQKCAGGVQSGYTEPEKLGVDRWLALVGATDFAPVDKLIVDAGSAITIDLLTKDGIHLGGAILPGFNTTIERFKQVMSKANFNHPDILSIVEPGCSTEACIRINYKPSATGKVMIDDLVESWLGRLAPNAILIVAGGDAGQILSRTSHPRHEVPDLVFRGMIKQLESLE